MRFTNALRYKRIGKSAKRDHVQLAKRTPTTPPITAVLRRFVRAPRASSSASVSWMTCSTGSMSSGEGSLSSGPGETDAKRHS